MTTTNAPMCEDCSRYRPHWPLRDRPSCDAFLEGIPEAIYYSHYDHTKPYQGDGGLLFKPKPHPED